MFSETNFRIFYHTAFSIAELIGQLGVSHCVNGLTSNLITSFFRTYTAHRQCDLCDKVRIKPASI